MDELEILKKDWKKRESSFNQLTETDIYKMLHKRSSSIVKWILIISVVEIVFWSIINVFTADEKYFKTLEMYHLKTVMILLSIINYAVIAYFIYLFYKNYKAINTTDNVKSLMKNILKTRKTVQNYVWYNLGMTFVIFVIVFAFQFMYDPNIELLVDKATKNIDKATFYFLAFFFYTILILIFLLIIWVFYKLVYGILLKRLNNNYKELQKLDL